MGSKANKASVDADKQVKAKASTAVGQVIDYGEYAGKGFEGQTRDDIAIPFIAVLQALSPQVESMEGAKAGMLYNTVTEELLDGKTGQLFVPALTQHVFVEWVPRAKGGGFKAIHEINSEVVKKAREASKEFGKYMVGENDLVETYYVYGVLVDEQDALGFAVIAFTSTKIKVYKKFNTRLRTFRVRLPDGRQVSPPLFAHLNRLTSVKESNAKGDFHNFSISPANGDLASSLLKTDDPRFLAAVECKKLVESGAARADFSSQDKSGDSGDENIPF